MTQVSLYLFSLLELIWNCITFPQLPSWLKLWLTLICQGPDSIPAVVLKNFEPELSYLLAELFNICVKESCFPDCWKVSLEIPVFANVGERCMAKNYCPVSLLSVVGKVFAKLLNNRIVDHLEECGLFSDFRYGFTSSQFTADLLTAVFDRSARAFNKSGAAWAVALDISKAFNRVWHTGLFHRPKSYGITSQIFGLILSFLCNRQLQVFLDGRFSQENPVNAWFPNASIFDPTLFLIYIYDLIMLSIILSSMVMRLIYYKCDQASDLWQHLELAVELESYLKDTVDWGRKWLVDFSAGKSRLFNQSNNTDVKMDGFFLEEKL